MLLFLQFLQKWKFRIFFVYKKIKCRENQVSIVIIVIKAGILNRSAGF